PVVIGNGATPPPSVSWRAFRLAALVALLIWSAWVIGALWFLPLRGFPVVATVAYAAGSIYLIGTGARRCAARLTAVVTVVWCLAMRPSNDRPWTADQARLPEVTLAGDGLTVRGVRTCDYRSTTDYTVHHDDRDFDLRELETVWFIVEPFSTWSAAAHTFLSFGFSDGRYLAISVEIRKEVGEHFSPLAGIYRSYELTYVIGDERDLVRLRANYRKDDVYLYRARATREQARALFVSMLERSQRLHDRPEFYNTLTNTCTTNIVSHIRSIWPGRVPYSLDVLLPGNADRLAYDIGLIDDDAPFEVCRQRHRINDRSLLADQDADFSRLIRIGF
ncbi:MAG: DUF4105 domain-containing protein, partial [Planctomycetes bacterium]|nr:DUF4105 domain-containing protein [Planctomycetota bacterium]